jgi:hypothetical protein
MAPFVFIGGAAAAAYKPAAVARGGAGDAQEAREMRDACTLDNHVVVHAYVGFPLGSVGLKSAVGLYSTRLQHV